MSNESKLNVEIYDIADIHEPEFAKYVHKEFDDLQKMLDGDYSHIPIGCTLSGPNKLPSDDFLFCDGSIQNIKDYPKLAEKLGESHKLNETQFKLPVREGFKIPTKYEMIRGK